MNKNGLTKEGSRVTMEKPYLSVKGLDFFGHAVFHKADEPLPRHTHENCIEIVYVFSGEQTYYAGSRAYPLVGGQAFLSFESEPHRSGEDFQGAGEIYWAQLNLSCDRDFLGLNEELSKQAVDDLKRIDKHVFSFDKEIKRGITCAFLEFLQHGASAFAVVSFAKIVMQTLKCAYSTNLSTNRFDELGKYIGEHIFEPITLDMLSEACGLSVSTIAHGFKEYYGRTPSEYVSYTKINASKKLLLSGKSVTQAAMEMGFNTSDYYSTVFKKYNRVSPSAWLKAQRENER